jgi:hypothetical protein
MMRLKNILTTESQRYREKAQGFSSSGMIGIPGTFSRVSPISESILGFSL